MPRKPKRKSTQAQIDAVKRYQEKHDEFKIRCQKGMKDKYREAAKERGLSLNEFALRALDAAMLQKDLPKTQQPEEEPEDLQKILNDEIRKLKKNRRY